MDLPTLAWKLCFYGKVLKTLLNCKSWYFFGDLSYKNITLLDWIVVIYFLITIISI